MTTAALRVVSLVPSATETLLALGVTPVACTRFCEQPGIPTVGGTKDPHVGEIVALAPDLVVVNDEENRLEDAAALTAAGLVLHEMSPRSVTDVGPAVADLAASVGVPTPSRFGPDAWPDVLRRSARPVRGRVAVLIWCRPWMTMGHDTYGASLLELLGWASATVGDAGADRYPTVTMDEIAMLAPGLVLLPDEPYPFSARHIAEVSAGVPTARVQGIDGRDLFWWGTRTPDALARMRSAGL